MRDLHRPRGFFGEEESKLKPEAIGGRREKSRKLNLCKVSSEEENLETFLPSLIVCVLYPKQGIPTQPQFIQLPTQLNFLSFLF